MIKIILAEDHQLVRNGIRSLLERESDIVVTGEANNGIEVLELLDSGILADVILVDLQMPEMDGLELTLQLKNKYPQVKVMILSMTDHERYISDAFENGACGYLLKTVESSELILAIRQVYHGRQYLSVELGLNMFKKVANQFKKATNTVVVDGVELSEQEQAVLALIAEGYSNQEIAAELFTSKRTVEAHRYHMMGKMGVKNTATLIRYAFRAGLIS